MHHNESELNEMKNKRLSVIIIAVLIIIASGVILSFNIVKNKKIVKTEYYLIKDEIISEQQAKELIELIPFSVITIGNIKDAYSGSYVTKNDIKEMLLSSAVIGNFDNLKENFSESEKTEIDEFIGQLEKTRLFITKRSKIDDILKSRYNTNITELEIKEIDDKLYFKTLGEKYVILNLNFKPSEFTKDVFSYEIGGTKEEIIIDETAIFSIQKNNIANYYANTTIKSENRVLDLAISSDDQLTSSNLKELKKAAKIFRHTFKKTETGNYFWYSTEQIKQES